MSTMNIGDILEDLPEIPAEISVLLRGNHGIGKSSLVRQIAKTIKANEGLDDFPVIDRRLSQLTQGDIIGLPSVENRRTSFNPPDWYKLACEKPVMLFLDELNRAEVEVMQAAFQIVLDRELNGHHLHPQTRVYAAVNTQQNYNVQQIDPALLDRFFVVDVLFTTGAWTKWARETGSVHESIVDFIEQNPAMLVPPASYDVVSVQPSPRSWERASKIVSPLLLKGEATGQYDTEKIRRAIASMCGTEVSMAYDHHLKSEFKFSGEDVLNNYINIRDKMKRHKVDVMVGACEKLVAYADTLETITPEQGKHLEKFIWDLEKDHRVTLWQKLARAGNPRLPFIRSIHEFVKHAICDAFGVPVGPAGVGVLPNVHGAVQRAEDSESK